MFADYRAAQIALDCAKWLHANERWVLWVAVVMPEHVHFVVALRDRSLAAVMKSFKEFTGRSINTIRGTNGPIWQSGYYDHGIRNDESFYQIVRYCIENPVNANMVDLWTEYPFTFVDVEGFRPGEFENVRYWT